MGFRCRTSIKSFPGSEESSVAWLLRAIAALIVASLLALAPAWAGPFDDGVTAYEQGDYATALRLWQPLAAKGGDAIAQYYLGLMYANGRGVPKDYEQAYFWYLLASVGGDADSVRNRELMESRLTAEQRAEAQADARKWKPTPAAAAD